MKIGQDLLDTRSLKQPHIFYAKKSWPILQSISLNKTGQDFLDIQCERLELSKVGFSTVVGPVLVAALVRSWAVTVVGAPVPAIVVVVSIIVTTVVSRASIVAESSSETVIVPWIGVSLLPAVGRGAGSGLATSIVSATVVVVVVTISSWVFTATSALSAAVGGQAKVVLTPWSPARVPTVAAELGVCQRCAQHHSQ